MTVLWVVAVVPLSASSEKVLHNFISYPLGVEPDGPLVADGAGNMYGTAVSGGDHSFGAVFKLSRSVDNKWSKRVIYSFKGGSGDGISPISGVIFDGAGNLYGITLDGGPVSCGFVFELSPAPGEQWTETILHSFTYKNGDGCWPVGTLTFDRYGNLYGTTALGDGGGVVFELTPSSGGWVENIVYQFSSDEAAAGVILDDQGDLYGTTNQGDVFQLVHEPSGWKQNVLCNCLSYDQGLILDREGNLYGAGSIAYYGDIFELKRRPHGWKLITLYTFGGGSDGWGPGGPLVFDPAGNLYGVTGAGGVQNQCANHNGCGTIFKLMPTRSGPWKHKVLYAFKNSNDGEGPSALILDPAGNLYGNTAGGGNQYCNGGYSLQGGCGTVYKLAAVPHGRWKHELILSFYVGDGQQPGSALISDSSGNLYGTAPAGGAYNGGIVFELTRQADGSWKETILHSFGGPNDSSEPSGSLVFDGAGNLYGVAYAGLGGVFKLTPNSNGTWTESLLYSFTGYPNDGANPNAGLVFDALGNLYGTTSYGGSGRCLDPSDQYVWGCGTAFELSPSSQRTWTETILHAFTGYPNDGFLPNATLLLDSAGNLYGSTSNGGSDGRCVDSFGNSLGCGTLFELSREQGGGWSETGYYSFAEGNSNSGVGTSGLSFGPQGGLYGTAGNTGTYGGGTFFQVSAGSGSWTLTPLYNFGSYNGDGLGPNAITFDSSSNVYGTTSAGGSSSTCSGCGTVFELSPSSNSWTERILYSFNGPYADGKLPTGGIVLDASGDLFGTTSEGGVDYGYTGEFPVLGGTVFEVKH